MEAIYVTYVWWYLAIINVLAFIVYGLDKHYVEGGRKLVPDGGLLALAVAGGSMGAYCGIYIFTHKKKDWKFKYGILLVYALQLVVLIRMGIF